MAPIAKGSSAFQRPLDHLLGTPASVRVLRVLVEHGGALAPPTIASRARVTRQSAWNALNRLLQIGVVEGVGEGRATSYRLAGAHPLVPPLQALFATERQRLERLFATVRDIAVKMKPRPIAIWLYGSVARGEDDPNSDIDLAVLSPEGETSRHELELSDSLWPVLGDVANRLSVIAMSPADVRRMKRQRQKLWANIRRDAIPLYGPAPSEAVRD